MLLAILFLISVCYTSVSGNREPRFLDAVVHNRVAALEQSHQEHKQQTHWLRNVIFGSSITLSILLFLLIAGIIYLCFRVRAPFTTSPLPLFSSSTSPSSSVPTDLVALHRVLNMFAPSNLSNLSPSSYYPGSIAPTTVYSNSNSYGLHPVPPPMLKY